MNEKSWLKQILTENDNETYCLVAVGGFLALLALIGVFVYNHDPTTFAAFGQGVGFVCGAVILRRKFEGGDK